MITKINMVAKDVVLRVLFQRPEKQFSKRELGREAGYSVRSAIIATRELEEEGLVEVQRAGNTDLVRAKRNREFLEAKRAHNLKSLLESGLVVELEKLAPEAVVLFGSYARGEDTSESDIDVAVVGGVEAEPDLQRFEKELHRRVSLHRIPDPTREEPEFRNTLANGVVLSGYLKVVG